jgi:hypothetical protein
MGCLEGFRLGPFPERFSRGPARENDVGVAFRGAQDLHVYEAGHPVNGPIAFRKRLLEILFAPCGYGDAIHDDDHSRDLTASAGICSA